MKQIILLIIASFVLTHGSFTQTENQQVFDINQEVQKIKNNIQEFEKIEKFKDSTGYRYVYLKDNEVQIISVLFIDENIHKKVEWYFSNGELIYSEKIWTNIDSNIVIENELCYLGGRKLILWTKGNDVVDDTSKEFKDFESELITYCDKLSKERD